MFTITMYMGSLLYAFKNQREATDFKESSASRQEPREKLQCLSCCLKMRACPLPTRPVPFFSSGDGILVWVQAWVIVQVQYHGGCILCVTWETQGKEMEDDRLHCCSVYAVNGRSFRWDLRGLFEQRMAVLLALRWHLGYFREKIMTTTMIPRHRDGNLSACGAWANSCLPCAVVDGYYWSRRE